MDINLTQLLKDGVLNKAYYDRAVHDADILALQSIPTLTLTYVDLTVTRITDVAVKYLATHTAIKCLSISCTSITNEALKSVAKLTNLECLNLSSCSKITDEGLEHLAVLSSLKELNVTSTAVTKNGVEWLKERIPALVVTTDRIWRDFAKRADY